MSFSEQEIKDLLRSWVTISFAFSLILGKASGFFYAFLLSGLTVGIAFLFHELAHKFVAQRFNCLAEFRAFDTGLMLAVLTAFLVSFLGSGFLFAAPGAVVIGGLVTADENGKIAASGPLVNIILALLFLVFLKFLPVFLPISGFLIQVLSYGYVINSSLALFNLLPFFQLDGLKIFAWNRKIWGILFATAAIFVFFL